MRRCVTWLLAHRTGQPPRCNQCCEDSWWTQGVKHGRSTEWKSGARSGNTRRSNLQEPLDYPAGACAQRSGRGSAFRTFPHGVAAFVPKPCSCMFVLDLAAIHAHVVRPSAHLQAAAGCGTVSQSARRTILAHLPPCHVRTSLHTAQNCAWFRGASSRWRGANETEGWEAANEDGQESKCV